MSSHGAVALIIPTRNRCELVGRAIESVLGQSRLPDEIIVVDDCSEDGTRAALLRFGSQVQVLRADQHIERGAARNWGVRSSKAPIIAFLDSDDEWEPDKLAVQLAFWQSHKDAACVTALSYIDEIGTYTGKTYVPGPQAIDRLPFENPLLGSGSSLLLARSIFESVGGFPEDRDVQGSEDWIFLNLLKRKDVQLFVLPQPLVRVRIHSTNDTGDPHRIAQSMWAAAGWMADRGVLDPPMSRRVHARVAGVIARSYAANRMWTRALWWTRRAIGAGARFEAIRSCALVLATVGMTLVTRRRIHDIPSDQ